MNNKVVVGIILALLIGGGYYLYTPEETHKVSEMEQQSESPNKETERATQDFVEKYQPNTETASGLKYSYQLEDVLVNSGKPTLFTASVDDIFRKDGEMYIRFAPSFYDWDGPRIFYTLSGCTDKVDQIVSTGRALFFDGYIVVAKITNIQKPLIRIDGTAYGEDVELEIATPETFVATGNCLDLHYVENLDILYE